MARSSTGRTSCAAPRFERGSICFTAQRGECHEASCASASHESNSLLKFLAASRPRDTCADQAPVVVQAAAKPHVDPRRSSASGVAVATTVGRLSHHGGIAVARLAPATSRGTRLPTEAVFRPKPIPLVGSLVAPAASTLPYLVHTCARRETCVLSLHRPRGTLRR